MVRKLKQLAATTLIAGMTLLSLEERVDAASKPKVKNEKSTPIKYNNSALENATFEIINKYGKLGTGFFFETKDRNGRDALLLVSAQHLLDNIWEGSHIEYVGRTFKVDSTIPYRKQTKYDSIEESHQDIFILSSKELKDYYNQTKNIVPLIKTNNEKTSNPICSYGLNAGERHSDRLGFTKGKISSFFEEDNNKYIHVNNSPQIFKGHSGAPLVICGTNELVGMVSQVCLDNPEEKVINGYIESFGDYKGLLAVPVSDIIKFVKRIPARNLEQFNIY